MSGPGIFADRIPQHRHCVKCGKAFVGDDDFCSAECRAGATQEAKKKLRKLGIIWVAIVAVTIAVVVMVGL